MWRCGTQYVKHLTMLHDNPAACVCVGRSPYLGLDCLLFACARLHLDLLL
jgi:hypothetical protein